ncbi:MAG: hypothetical protein LBJ82_05575 [Deltaproteobacteria bacterium]|jgi:hypothetical protein|nr:hypothetical protein [Deltaproteobacteria bacterium]
MYRWKKAGKPWAVVLMALFCLGWIQPGAFFLCPSARDCVLRAALPQQGEHPAVAATAFEHGCAQDSPGGHALAEADFAHGAAMGSPAGHALAETDSGQAADLAALCSDGEDHSLSRTCCQLSPAVLPLEQAQLSASPSVSAPMPGGVFFSSLRPDPLFRPPQSL